MSIPAGPKDLDQKKNAKQKMRDSVKKVKKMNAIAPQMTEEELQKEVQALKDKGFASNKPKKIGKVNFADHLEELQKRTETELPFTLTQVEDAMYLERDKVVTLEYHYYQKDCSYN